MIAQRCPRCDQVISRRQPVHFACAVQRARLPLTILLGIIVLVAAGAVILAMHFI